jgi:PhnB protein
MAVKSRPEGYHSVTPYLVATDVSQLIDFLKDAFGAQVISPPFRRPDGSIMHCELRIGDSPVMMGEPMAQNQPMPTCLYVYVDDTDATYRRALQAGGTSVMEPADQFYGDRSAGVRDPAGNIWYVATHQEDLTAEEMERRAQEVFANQRA